jgi:hypothetical protein
VFLVDFLMESHGSMSDTVIVHWRVRPVTPPRPIRHCATCNATRIFQSSGKVRLNANGRLLDAWLIYRCEACARTWNRPLVERTPVSAIAAADLSAMQASTPGWVERWEFDLAGLARYAPHVSSDCALLVTPSGFPARQFWAEAELVVVAAVPVAQRVDRFLAAVFWLSRTQVRRMGAAGSLDVGDPARLTRPLDWGITVRFRASGLTEAVRAHLASALCNPPDEIPP